MICNKCGVDCVGFPTGDPVEDVCSDCAFPAMTKAFESARKHVEEQHFNRTGVEKTAGELFRSVLGM